MSYAETAIITSERNQRMSELIRCDECKKPIEAPDGMWTFGDQKIYCNSCGVKKEKEKSEK